MNNEYRQYYMDTLSDLVGISSVSMHELAAAEYIRSRLEAIGCHAELDRLDEHSANVTARMRGRGGAPILVGGHIDTVGVADGWTREPLKLTCEGDLAYGLGAGDMKGGIAALLTVLKLFSDTGEAPAGDVIFMGVADEERFSLGAEAFAAKGTDAEYCVLAEPHYDEFVIGATGKTLLGLTVRGECGHAAKPETGVNAIENMTAFLFALDKKYRALYDGGGCGSHCVLHIWNEYPEYSLNIPDVCRALLNKQLLPDESEDAFIADVRGLFAEACPKCTLDMELRPPHYPSYVTDVNNAHFKRLERLAAATQGRPVRRRVNSAVSDANIIESRLGIPAVLFGPQGVNIHKANEHLVLSTAWGYMDTMYAFLSGSDAGDTI